MEQMELPVEAVHVFTRIQNVKKVRVACAINRREILGCAARRGAFARANEEEKATPLGMTGFWQAA
jgi:hypothetical protein